MEPSTNHHWPTDQAQHKWGKWHSKDKRRGATPATQYRVCIDEQCGASETRVAPGG